jgi:hypothetical protein
MTRDSTAEILLSAVCGPKRAKEIVGDLLEQEGAEEQSFYTLMLATLVAFTWRWVAGIVLAGGSTVLAVERCAAHIQTFPSVSVVPLQAGILCCLWGTCLWSVVVLNTLRYGVKSKITDVGLGLASFLFVLACFARESLAADGVIAVGLMYLVICISRRSLRGALATVISSAASYAIVFWLLLHLVSVSSRSPILIGTQFFAYWFVSFIFQAVVLAYTRNTFFAYAK